MWIWRVQSFELVTVPENKYGQFYQGDSYVVLKVRENGMASIIFHHLTEYVKIDHAQAKLGCSRAQHSLLARLGNYSGISKAYAVIIGYTTYHWLRG